MPFKDSTTEFQIIDINRIAPDPKHPRQNIEESSLKGLTNSIQKMGVIHPLVIRPDNTGNFIIVAGERRRQAAILAGEETVPAVVRNCSPDETLEVQVFENIGLGVRAALEPRDMANAIQAIAERFESQEEAAQHFGRAPTWLSQATAAANLSEKVTALLDSGKISSTGAAVQLEKLAKKDEAKAETLIDQIEQLPEGEKVSKKVVDTALSEVSTPRKKPVPAETQPSPEPTAISTTAAITPFEQSETSTPPWEEMPVQSSSPRSKVNPGKVKRVAEILGLDHGDEEEILARLIDEFLALNASE